MNNSGQMCISIERVYVEAPVYDEFVAKVVEKVARCARARRARRGRRRRDHARPQLRRQAPRRRRPREGRHVPPAAAGAGRRALLRADGAHGRRPHDELHDRGDVRADAADHEGRATPRRHAARQRLALRLGARLHARHRSRRGDGATAETGAVYVNDSMVNYIVFELPMGGWKDSGIGSATARGGSASTAPQLATTIACWEQYLRMPPAPWREPRPAGLRASHRQLQHGVVDHRVVDVRPAPGDGRGERQRRDDQLHRAGAADGRREGLGPRLPPRGGRHPQVLLPAGDRRDEAGDEEGTVHVPLQAPHLAAVHQF